MTAHVGKIPVGKKGENRFMHTSALAAMGFNFGFEQDLSILSDDERAQTKEYITVYSHIRELVQFGDFYRLENPFASSTASWITVSPDRSRAAAFFFQTRKRRNDEERRVRLHGLDEDRRYQCREAARPGQNNPYDRIYLGAELMESGLRIPEDGYEFASRLILLEVLEDE
jgi:alpha-galactosidase